MALWKITSKVFSPERAVPVARWHERHFLWVLGGALTLTLLSIYPASRIELDTDITALLPHDAVSVQRLDRILEKTGGFGDLMVMIESQDLEDSVQYAERLLPRIRELPWVSRADFEIDTSVFEDNALLFLDLEDLKDLRKRVETYISELKLRYSPFFIELEGEPEPELVLDDLEEKYKNGEERQRLFASPDGEILIIAVYPEGVTGDIGFARRIYQDLVETVAANPPRSDEVLVNIGGTYRNRLDEYDAVVQNVRMSVTVACVGIALLLILYFRSLMMALLSVVPLILSLSWTLALTSITIGRLNLVTVFLVVILLGLGIDFGIHMLTRFAGERQAGRERFEALANMMCHAGRSSLTAGLTTGVAFISLTLSSFLGFRQFGFIAGLGVLLALVAYLVVLPSLLVLSFRKRPPKPVWLPNNNVWHPTQQKKRLRPTVIVPLVIGAVLTVASLVFLPGVSFEEDLTALRSQVQSTREFNAKMRRVFERPRDPAVVYVHDREEAERLQHYVEEQYVERPGSLVAEVRSLADVLPSNQDEKLGIIADIREMIEKERKAIPDEEQDQLDELKEELDVQRLTRDDVPPALARPFLGLPGTPGQLVFIFQKKTLLDLRNAIPFYRSIHAIETPWKTYYPVNETLIYVELVLLLQRDALVAILIASAAIALMVLLDIGSIRRSAIVLISVGAGIVWMLGIASAIDLRLNIFNLVVLPSILGMGVDAAVHLQRSAEVWGRFGTKRVLRETGAASAASTLTTIIGFGSLMLGAHPGLESIGALAVIGLSCCFLSALLLVPALLSLPK